MKATLKFLSTLIGVLLTGILFSSFYYSAVPKASFKFPYKQAGLTERQAAAHLLSRFTYGPTPGEIDAVVKMGLENWFQQQLDAKQADDTLKTLLGTYDALTLTNAQVEDTFPRGGKILRMAVKDGVINKDSVNKADKKEYRSQLATYMQQKGIKPPQELLRQFISGKILRATYTHNQLQEVLTDFWFNHFNVSFTKNDCSNFIPSYERDVIRPNALGSFQNLLFATAKSPAMLMFLDNFSSSGVNSNPMANNYTQLKKRFSSANSEMQISDPNSQKAQFQKKLNQNKKAQGLNENYAREVMELHTLGVDGGYTQQDVTQAARVLTGWTVFPMGKDGYGNGMQKIIAQVGENNLKDRGFVHEGDFLFVPSRHDTQEKTVLGKHFAANGGYEEGEQLLEMLAHHPSTAKFITNKLAVRFVSDNPAPTLLNKLSKTFTEKNGNVKDVLIAMVTAPEFWSKQALREKTKSPFELGISSVRSLNAQLNQPFQLYNWINRMGQKMYYYQAPTGFPDRGQYWINTGSLLNRMNFGLALASQRIPGIKIDLAALNNHHEPESATAALITYSKLILPERNLDETVKRLTPLLNDPNLEKKIDNAAGKTESSLQVSMASNDMMSSTADNDTQIKKAGKIGLKKNNYAAMSTLAGNNSMLSQVVGIIIGSPEFQRK